MGLDFWEICFELLDYDEINEVAAYGGFPTRYPHWKFGMEYEQLSKGYTYGLQKIYELVINNDPCYAYLMKSNSLMDQKLVMSHVCGHADFFKNNLWFAKTNRKMIDEMANHGTKIRRYAERHGHEEVERFLDACMSLDNLIDMHSPFIKRRREKAHEDDEPQRAVPRKLRSKEYMDRYVNPPEFMEEQKKRLTEAIEKSKNFPEQPERDVLLFMIEHAPLERWQRDILSMVREEAYYFVPQAMTKVMNEGWACLAPDSLVFTDSGLITMRALVSGDASNVCDGDVVRAVSDRNIIRDHETIEVRTRRGLRLVGSNNHRLMLPDGSWRRLDELRVGDELRVSGGQGLWAEHVVELSWRPRRRMQLTDVARLAGTNITNVHRHRAGRSVKDASAIRLALALYDCPHRPATLLTRRAPVTIPRVVDERLGSFLGYLVGDGHISRVKRNLGLTTGDDEQAQEFHDLARDLFGLEPRMKRDGGRWRVLLHSETLADFLTEGLGLTHGPSAREKRIPDVVLRSPEPVVRAFLRAYFDCDGHAGKQGVILSTTSDALAEQVQLLLLNYGVLTRRRRQGDGCWHVHAAGRAAALFAEKVGFGLARKQAALEAYVAERSWFKEERWEDEVVSLARGRGDVYDITVEETHRYAACGFVNHNSYWHSTLMTTKVLTDDEVVDYADHHAGTMGTRPGVLNPYKVGIELFRDIEERWNKGKFGAEWDECDDAEKKRTWDRKLGKGREKIFEVRRIYNDILFIDEFLTEDFAREQKLFTFEYSKQSGEYVIASREFKQIKEKLLFELTNWGNPFIHVESGNYENRGELYLVHRHDGHDLQQEQAKDVLRNLQMIWNRPVHIETSVEKRRKVLSFNGRKHSERTL
ncbi:MAG: SpoVR family protein [Planctomycetes bacterium]|nr:SpoVR family protein [Planctomycetota bacterium]